MWQPNKDTIIRGDDKQLAVFLLDDNCDPFSISGASAVKLLLKNQDGSILTKDAAQGFAWGYGDPVYCYTFNLSAAETALLQLGPSQTIELLVLYGAVQNKHAIKNYLTVVPPVI